MVVLMLPIFPVHICHGTDKSVGSRLFLVAHGYKLGIAVRVPNNLLFRFNHFQWGSLINLFCLYIFIYCLLVQEGPSHRIGNSHVGHETYSLHMFKTVGTFLPFQVPPPKGRITKHRTQQSCPLKPGWSRFAGPGEVSNEKRAPGCLGYIGDYTTQLYGDYSKPL